MSNLRQLGMAAQFYANQNRGANPVKLKLRGDGGYDPILKFPPEGLASALTGKDLVHPIETAVYALPSVFICPTGPTKGESGVTWHSYGFNSVVWRAGPSFNGKGSKVSDVKHASAKVYAMDWPSKSIEQGWNNITLTHPHHAVPGSGSQAGMNFAPSIGLTALYEDCWADIKLGRHGSRKNLMVNVLYFDWHVDSRTSAEMTRQWHRPTGGVGLPQLGRVPTNVFSLFVY